MSPQSTLVIRSHYGYLEISTRIWKSTHGTSHPWTGHCHLRDGATPLNNYCDHAAGKTIRQSSPISDGTGFSHGSECSEEEAVHGKTRNSLVCPPSLLPAGQCHCTVYHLDGWMALLSAGLPHTNKSTMFTFIYTCLANDIFLLAEMFRRDYGKDLVSKFGLQLCEETREVGTVLRQGKRSWELGHILEM